MAKLASVVLAPTAEWLALHEPEDIIEPLLPIVDPHHHLWDRRGNRYLLPELLADTGSGHHITHTVYIEAMAFYRAGVAADLRPLGEIAFAAGMAAMSESGIYGDTQVCAGIVGHVNLQHGVAARELLQAQIQAAGGRLRGIRHAGAWDASDELPNSHTQPPPQLYDTPNFRDGFAMLAPLNLVFEAWQYQPQLPDVIALARASPHTTIVLNHIGAPLGVGPYAGRGEAMFADWKRHMLELARCDNVVVKLGGMGMRIGMFDFHQRARPPSSAALAQAWQPWVATCIEAFGAARCMFESNFPVDKITSSYAVLWNAFKRLAAGASAAEKEALFSGTARRVYRI
jgi:L-fuconolactonase